MTPNFTYPTFLIPTGLAVLAALVFGIWAQARPGQGVRVVGQRPVLQGLGMALVAAGVGLGLAEPHWGPPEIPRLTVHVVVDASRSMLVPDCDRRSRWNEALAILDTLWSRSNPSVLFSLDLLTGDTIPFVPPGEDRGLLRDALRAVEPGDIGSPGTSLGRGIPQVVATAEPRAPAVVLLLSDGEETVDNQGEALRQALKALKEAQLPLFAIALGKPTPQGVPLPPDPRPSRGDGREPVLSTANPNLLQLLAEGSGGRMLTPRDNLSTLFQNLAQGQIPLPMTRSILPAHPELGAWLALIGLGLWLLATGKPMRSWRTTLCLALALGWNSSARSEVPLPQSVKAWIAQIALERGDLDTAQTWLPRGDIPSHRLLAAQVHIRSRNFESALAALAPLTDSQAYRPVPSWRAPALLLAARACVAMDRPEDARTFLERLLRESPGRKEAVHDLQSLIRDTPPPPPNPKTPPPPPPPRPSMGAQQDELEGIQQQLPQKPPPPPQGIKDL